MVKARKISVELRGRKTKYTKKLSDEICRKMAVGMSLREICRAAHMPHATAVRGWVVKDRDGFAQRYEEACRLRAWYWAEEMIEICDDGSNDYIERKTEDGSFIVFNNEHVQRSRLRLDTRKWLLSKLLTKTYGDKTTLEHQGRDGGAIQVNLNVVDSKL